MKLSRLILSIVAAGLLSPGAFAVRADDLTTLSGTTYRQAVAVHVEPDGITWRHATGVAKVDFADTPEAIRQAYHYDPTTAAAYHAAREQAQAATAEENRRLVQDAEARRKARFQQAVATGFTSAHGGTFTLQRGGILPQTNLAERLLGEQVAAIKDKEAAVQVESERNGFANQLLWKVLPALRGGTGAADVAVQNYRASAQHPLHEGTTHAWDDGAYQPNYSTGDYYKEVDRSAALLRNAGW